MAVYEIETADGAVYEVETRDPSMGASSSWGEPEVAASKPSAFSSVGKFMLNPMGESANFIKDNAENYIGAASRFLPYGDEVLGYANAGIDALGDETFDEALPKRLEQIRGYQKTLDREQPAASALASGMGALAMPVGSLVKGAKTLTGLAGRAAAEGGLYGFGYGFGESEGGLENRLNRGVNEGLKGSVFAPVAALGLRGAGKVAEKLPGTLEKMGVRQEAQAYGASYKNISDAIERMPEITDPDNYELPIATAIESFKKAGGGKSGMAGESLLADLSKQREFYGGQVEGLINEAQKAQNFKIIPKFKYVQSYLSKVGATQKDEARAIAEEMVGKIAKATKSGKLKAFQDEKIALGKSIKDRAWGQDELGNIKTDIAKRLYGDLRRTVEEGVELFTGKDRKVLAGLNRELGYRENLEPLFKQVLKTDEARTPIKSIFNLLSTTGGLGQSLIAATAGGAAGAPLGPLGMGLGAAAGLYSKTPSGQRDAATLLRKGADKLGFLPDMASGIRNFEFPRVFGSMQRDSSLPMEEEIPIEEESYFSPSIEITEPIREEEILPLKKKVEDDMKLTPQPDTDVSPQPNRKYKVDSALKNVLFKHESNNNPKAESQENEYMKAKKTGTAKGLGQLLDDTGKELFGRYKDILPASASPEKYDPFNETQNEILATNYLEELLDKYDGDLELALTAYHSGMGTVDKLLRKTKGSTLSDILPHLGKVGKSYARSIIENYKKQLSVNI